MYGRVAKNIEYEIRQLFEESGLPYEYSDIDLYEEEDGVIEFDARVYYSFEFFGKYHGITFELHGEYDTYTDAIRDVDIRSIYLE